jgi:uncharacterized protein (DUF169 family)
MIVNFEVDDEEIMSRVFYGLVNCSWIVGVKWDFEAVPLQKTAKVQYIDPEDEESTLFKYVTVKDLADALGKIVNSEVYHCGERVSANLARWDSCCSDYVLQFALFGKVVFG